jgi:hypothetical protein
MCRPEVRQQYLIALANDVARLDIFVSDILRVDISHSGGQTKWPIPQPVEVFFRKIVLTNAFKIMTEILIARW